MALQRRWVEYRHEETRLEGCAVWDDAIEGARPAVLVIHEFMGLGPYILRRADELARMGCVAFAADMFGKGVRPSSASEALGHSRVFRRDRTRMRERASAGLTAMATLPQADMGRSAAVGFSFGGCAALELARSGAELRGAVSFYGYLDTPRPEDARNIKGRVLALHGARDKVVPLDDALAFAREMRAADVDCQIEIYADAGHGFSNPTVQEDASTGSAYCPKTDERSWRTMARFLQEVFA